MDRLLTNLVLMTTVLALSACANLNSLLYSTPLPTSADKSGKAVHLDAKQRLLLVNELGKYCSEPNPDALAAYAASLGFGLGDLSAGATAAAGGQSSAASIGLRTQSITLMRDALFRMCEAYANGAVGTAQVAAFLSRSQDLTAVILAVEQLTGTVVANQAALTSTTKADSSASLVAVSELLDAALKSEERARMSLEQAVNQLASAESERNAADRLLANARAERNGLGTDATSQQSIEAEGDVGFRQAERDRAQRAVEAARKTVDIRQQALDNAARTKENIAAQQNQASTEAAGSTGGSAQFSEAATRVRPEKAATEAIAGAVESMVTEVLRKDYTIESCMAIVTSFPHDDDKWSPRQTERFEATRKFCFKLVDAAVKTYTNAITTVYSADSSSDRIDAWLKGPGNRERLKMWLNKQNPKVPVFALLQGDYGELRDRVIDYFEIP